MSGGRRSMAQSQSTNTVIESCRLTGRRAGLAVTRAAKPKRARFDDEKFIYLQSRYAPPREKQQSIGAEPHNGTLGARGLVAEPADRLNAALK